MDEVMGSLALRELLQGASNTGVGEGSMLVLSLDIALQVESGAWAPADGSQGRRQPGAGRRAQSEAHLQAMLARKLEATSPSRACAFDLAGQGEGGAGRINVSLLPRFSEAGDLAGYFLVARDMSHEDAGGMATRIAQDRLHVLLRHAADAIVTISQDGFVEDANLAAERLFDWPAGALIGQPVSALMPDPYAQLHQAWVERYLQTGRSGILNVGPRPLPALTRTGELVSVELSISEAWIGGCRKFVGVFRDIGERLEKDRQLREANAALAARVGELTAVRLELEQQSERMVELARLADAARASAEDADRA